MNFCVAPREIREINKRGGQISCGGGGVSKNHEKINVFPPPFILNLRVYQISEQCFHGTICTSLVKRRNLALEKPKVEKQMVTVFNHLHQHISPTSELKTYHRRSEACLEEKNVYILNADLLNFQIKTTMQFVIVRSGRSDQSVLKWNARLLRTSSGQNVPAHRSEKHNLHAVPTLRSAKAQKFGRLGHFHLNWTEPVLFGQPDRTNRKRLKYWTSYLPL